MTLGIAIRCIPNPDGDEVEHVCHQHGDSQTVQLRLAPESWDEQAEDCVYLKPPHEHAE